MLRKKENKERIRNNLKITQKKTFRLRKISVFTTNVNEISNKYLIILRQRYASEAGASGMKKVKNPLNSS